MTAREREIIAIYNKFKEMYPKGEVIICNPNTYMGYNFETGKRIILKQEIIEDDREGNTNDVSTISSEDTVWPWQNYMGGIPKNTR